MSKRILIAFSLILIFMYECAMKEEYKRTKIRFAIWGDVEEVRILNNIKFEFEKENPDIEIVFEHSPIESYLSKLLTEMAGGNPPDVAFMATSRFTGVVEKGIFLPLDEFIKNDKEIDTQKFYREIIKAFTVSGKLYVLPRDISAGSCIYYNKSLFDENGIKYPSDNWSITDFIDVAKKLTKYKNGRIIRFGFHTWIWQNFVYMYGGRIVDDVSNPKKFLLTSEKSLRGLKFYHDLMYKYKIMPTPIMAGSLDMSFTMMFTSESVAMILSGLWEVPVILKEAKFDWDIAIFPGYKNGVWGGGSGYGIISKSRHKEAAWRVVKYFAGVPGQIELSKSGLVQPAIRELSFSKYFLAPDAKPKNKIIHAISASYIIPDPMFDGWNEMLHTVINPNLDLYFYNKISLEEFKSRVDKEIKSRYKWLNVP